MVELITHGANLPQYPIIGNTIHVPGIVVVIGSTKDLDIGFRARTKTVKSLFQTIKIDTADQPRQLMEVKRLHKRDFISCGERQQLLMNTLDVRMLPYRLFDGY